MATSEEMKKKINKWFSLQHSSVQYQKSVDFLRFSLVAIFDSLNR